VQEAPLWKAPDLLANIRIGWHLKHTILQYLAFKTLYLTILLKSFKIGATIGITKQDDDSTTESIDSTPSFLAKET
jgi:hypothetical protein